MVARRDLNAPPARQLADIVAGLRDQQAQQKTGAAGVKDLGAAGDVVWTRPDATPVSVRDVDAELVDAVGRIEDAEQTSEGLAQRVTDAETLIGTVAGDLDVMESETLPNAVSSLEAADQAARDDLTALDGKLVTAQTDLDAAEASLAQLGTDLVAESAAREALDASVRADLGTLDDKLVTAFPGGVFDVSAELAQTIRNSVVQYAVGTSETTAPTTGWATTTPVRAAGEFIWFRTVITYADATTSTSSPALLTGNAGAPGPKGEDGTGVTIRGSFDTAAELPASGTDGDAYLVAGDLYVWNSIAGDWENVGTIQGPAGEPGVPGAPGSPGPAGIGVASVTPYYQRLASGSTAPAKPTAVTPTGWASTEPVWQASTELWRTERIVYSDATYAYTDVTRVAVFAGIDAAMTAANGKNKTTYSDLADASKPGPPPAIDYGRAAGDVHRNRRSSTGEIWAEYQWSGTAWKSVTFGNGVVTSMDAGKLTAGTASIQTAVIDKLWVDGLAANTLVAQSLSIAPGNMLIDGLGKTDAGRAAYGNGGFLWETGENAWVNRGSAPGNAQMFLNPPGTANYTAYTLEPGREYRFAYDIYVGGGTTRTRAAIRLTRKDGTTTFLGDGIEAGGDAAAFTDIPADTWVHVERTWKAPADAASASFEAQYVQSSATATVYMSRNLFVGPKASAVTIGAGVVGADQVNAQSVAGAVGQFIALSTDQLTAGTASIGSAVAQRFWADIATFNDVVADRVVVGGVTGDQIADGAVGAVKIEDGAVTTPKLLVTEDMSAAIVNAMSVNAKQLVVTEEAVLNHATLIGQTVVDDINVQGKLIGQDGVFTGTVDFENVNVTNELLASKISGEYLYGTVVEGGEIRTDDTLPGRVTLADDAYVSSLDGVARPGIRVEPEDATGYATLPGVGPHDVGMTIDGGKLATGESSTITMFPTAATIRSFRADGGTGSAIQSSSLSSFMRTYNTNGAIAGEMKVGTSEAFLRSNRADGSVGGTVITNPTASYVQAHSGTGSERGWVRARTQDAELAYVASDNTYSSQIRADANEAFLYTRAGGTERYLTVDASGIWVKTNKSGSWEVFNLEETANDTGWQAITPEAGITGAGSPGWRNKGGVVWLRGQLTLTSGSWAAGWTALCTLPAQARPATALRRPAAIPGTGGAVLQVGSTGLVQVYLPATLTGAAEMHLGGLFFPLG